MRGLVGGAGGVEGGSFAQLECTSKVSKVGAMCVIT